MHAATTASIDGYDEVEQQEVLLAHDGSRAGSTKRKRMFAMVLSSVVLLFAALFATVVLVKDRSTSTVPSAHASIVDAIQGHAIKVWGTPLTGPQLEMARVRLAKRDLQQKFSKKMLRKLWDTPTCSGSSACDEGYFCNFDLDASGWCQPCNLADPESGTDAAHHNCTTDYGLPQKGADNCQEVCKDSADEIPSGLPSVDDADNACERAIRGHLEYTFSKLMTVVVRMAVACSADEQSEECKAAVGSFESFEDDITKECKEKGHVCSLSEAGHDMAAEQVDICVPKECHEQAQAETEAARTGETLCRNGGLTECTFNITC
mmetsp:Transcript_37594/g.106183  ORF Transcript_37594/g.106183 Transcript_37594/m.106183 type:complete len:320 (+) Transcript_37594:91-1050(+)